MVKIFSLFLAFFLFLLLAAGEAEDIYVFEEIVVSATKIPEKRAEVPNALVIKSTEDIEVSPAKGLGDLLSNEPGIDWRTYGDYGGASEQLHIRGMPAEGTQVFLNGININSPSLGVADLSKIPMENIEKIEVVKGSGSLLYGSGAMGGTVNLFTKEPNREKIDLKLKGGYGTQDTYRLSFQHGRFLKKDFGYYITAGRTETDGFRDNSHLRQNDLSLKLLFDRGEAIRVSLYADYIEGNYGVPGVKPPKGTQEFSIGGVKFYNDKASSLTNKGEDRDGNILLEVKGNPKERFSYNLKGYFRNMNNYYYQRYASTGGTGSETWVINTTSGAEGNITFIPIEKTKILVGAEYKEFGWRRKTYDFDSSESRTGKTRNRANIYTRALFTEAEYKPLNFLKLIGGIREEHHSAFGEKFVPLFGAVVNPKDTVTIKITHGRHFNAPTPNDLFWPETLYEKGNPNLKPEIGCHSDITYEHSLFENNVLLTLSYFAWKIDRKIIWQPDAQGVWSPINLEDYGAKGLETGIRLGPFKDLSFSLSYTYTDAYEKARNYTIMDYGWPPLFPPQFEYTIEKRRATMSPRNQFKGELTYKKSDFEATLVAKYVDQRIGLYRTEYISYPTTKTVKYEIDPYWTVDLRLKKRFLKRWICTFDAKNIFDKDYTTRLGVFYDSAGKGTVSGYPGAGRSFFLSLSYEL